MGVGRDVGVEFSARLDAGDAQVGRNSLHSGGVLPRRRRQGQHTQSLVRFMQLGHHCAVGIAALGPMGFIQYQQRHASWVCATGCQVVREELGSAEHDALGGPVFAPFFRAHGGPQQLRSVFHWQACDGVAGFDLLRDQRTCRRHEHHQTLWKPAVEIVHDDTCNERLAQARWQRHQRVVEEGRGGDVQLILALGVLRVHWEHPRVPRTGAQPRQALTIYKHWGREGCRGAQGGCDTVA